MVLKTTSPTRATRTGDGDGVEAFCGKTARKIGCAKAESCEQTERNGQHRGARIDVTLCRLPPPARTLKQVYRLDALEVLVAAVYGDITEAFGQTPLVRLNRVVGGLRGDRARKTRVL